MIILQTPQRIFTSFSDCYESYPHRTWSLKQVLLGKVPFNCSHKGVSGQLQAREIPMLAESEVC